MDWRDVITFEPDKMFGKPCIRGLRFTVWDVLGYLDGGMAEEEFLEEFPDLTADDIAAARQFAAEAKDRAARFQHEVAV